MARTYEISTEKGFDRLLVALTEECFNLDLERLQINALLETVQEFAPMTWKQKHPRILEDREIVKNLPEEEEAEEDDDE